MASTINTNTYSLNAQTNLAKNSLGLRSALERLSSGLRVNSARDDATGLASGMQIDAAARITQIEMRQEGDKISSAQIADGALSVVGDIVTRIMELTKMGGGDTEIGLLVTQASTIQSEANAAITKFSGTSFAAVSVTSTANAATLTSVSTERTKQGAAMNNAEFAIQSKQVSYENQQAARSRIMDADFAEETSRLSRFQILQQAGTAMVAQANAIPQNVLTLLR
jgi:flagellin